MTAIKMVTVLALKNMKKISYFVDLNVVMSRLYCSMKRKVKFYKVYALCPAGEDE